MATDEALWNDEQAAQFLNLSPLTLRKARMTGNGPAFLKLGHTVRYDPAEVRRWCGERIQHSTAEQSRPPLTPQHPRGPGRPRKTIPAPADAERDG
jgi:hypothetical protein